MARLRYLKTFFGISQVSAKKVMELEAKRNFLVKQTQWRNVLIKLKKLIQMPMEQQWYIHVQACNCGLNMSNQGLLKIWMEHSN